jgi:tetratricopeptide (TPR) repeat protein
VTNRIRSRHIWLGLAGGLFIGAGLWLTVGSGWSRRDPLELGLNCVENADADGVDRIEHDLIGAGHRDEAAVLRCAWLARRGRYAEVLRRLPPEMIDGPQRRHVLRLAGESLFHLGDTGKAELLLMQSAVEFPDEVAAHRLLAAMYYDLGANTLALRELAEVQRLAPLDYRPHQLAGMIHIDGEDFARAIQQLKQAIERNPPDDTRDMIELDLAKALMRNREYQAAVDLLTVDRDSATRGAPDRPAVLAECYWSLGERDRAMTLVEAILQSDSMSTPALRLKSRLLEERGQVDGALTALRQVLAAEPYDVESRYQLVQLLGIRGLIEERDREQREYQRYRGLQDQLVKFNLQASDEPDAVAPRRELVRICQELGRHKLAEMWQRAVAYCEKREQLRKSVDRNRTDEVDGDDATSPRRTPNPQ